MGITGHQGLDASTASAVSRALVAELSKVGALCGIGSLAEGADQLFAEETLRQGGSLVAVIPSARYETSFSGQQALDTYRRLLGRAETVIELGYDAPGEEAYWAAGKEVVNLSERMVAVWDGKPAGGLGGTADVVAFARLAGKPVDVIWPPGAGRN
ncbi:MAG: hypothetical protein JST53_07585 [Actinobacteria bacterium]|nr:hypothetical protein [Actinomycetota bacterium]